MYQGRTQVKRRDRRDLAEVVACVIDWLAGLRNRRACECRRVILCRRCYSRDIVR